MFFLDRRAFLPFLFRFGVCGFQLPTHARGSTRYARACRCTVLLSDWPPRDGEMSALPDQTSSGNDSIQKPSDIDIDQSEPWVLSLRKRARNMIRKNGEQCELNCPLMECNRGRGALTSSNGRDPSAPRPPKINWNSTGLDDPHLRMSENEGGGLRDQRLQGT